MTTESQTVQSLSRSLVESTPQDRIGGQDLNWRPVKSVMVGRLEQRSPTEEYSSKEDDE